MVIPYEIELNYMELGNRRLTLFLPLEERCLVPGLYAQKHSSYITIHL